MVIDAIDAALQDREVTFCGVRMGVAADVFFLSVIDGAVSFELLADRPIDAALCDGPGCLDSFRGGTS